MKQQDHHAEWMRFSQMLSPNSNPQLMQLMGKLRVAAHTVNQRGEQSLDEAGLSFAQFRILLGLLFNEVIRERIGLNPSEISERQGTNRNTISALLRNLESAELVTRELDSKDRRKFNICLTDAGRALVREHALAHFAMVDQFFSVLDAEDVAVFGRILDKLNEASR